MHRDKLARRKTPRQRAVGGGGQFHLSHRDQLLLTVIWLRRYPTHETLGYTRLWAICLAWMPQLWDGFSTAWCRCWPRVDATP
jgi:hypothetical protein